MATTEEEDVPPKATTVADLLGNVWQEASEAPRKAVERFYGPKGPSAYPLALLLVLGAAVAWGLQPLAIVILVLLAVWVGTSPR